MKYDTVKLKERLQTLLVENPSEIPEDLKPNTYRWRQYLYVNLFKEKADKLEHEDKLILVQLWLGLLDCHTICWTRKKVHDLNPDNIIPLRPHLSRVFLTTKSLKQTHAILYMYRMLDKKQFFVDDYLLEQIPQLQRYVRET